MQIEIGPERIAVASRAGFECVAAWADLLDRINVFPVADGDTGTNLRVSLAPLRACERDCLAAQDLLGSGHGNSGNIACTFLAAFLRCDGTALGVLARNGRDAAYGIIADPQPGTMLSIFDTLCQLLDAVQWNHLNYPVIRSRLAETVLSGISRLRELESAGVVDSGALGMFIFFDAFFHSLTEYSQPVASLDELFGSNLEVAAGYRPPTNNEHCVEAVLKTTAVAHDLQQSIDDLGGSAVVIPGEGHLKVHLHTTNPAALRKSLASHGDVSDWSSETMVSMEFIRREKKYSKNRVRIMSDAAGSIPLDLARKYGILLQDSYIISDGRGIPESLCNDRKLYDSMERGRRVTTAQASSHERYLHYQAACQQHGKLLYICTGSAYTGNYATAKEWQRKTDTSAQMVVMDSGAASGRLGLIALLAARLAGNGASVREVVSCVEDLRESVEEYVFINEMKYLVAGGRVSWGKGFFADLLHMKPVISPHAEGVRKVTTLRNRDAQLDFAKEKLGELEGEGDGLMILLQYTDNQEWLETVVEQELRNILPAAELLLVPLSLTSGVHMGPGTWSVAFGDKGGGKC